MAHGVASSDPSPRMIAVAEVHAALVAGSWLFASLVYAVVIARSRQIGWIAVDAGMIAACSGLVYARRPDRVAEPPGMRQRTDDRVFVHCLSAIWLSLSGKGIF